MYPILILLYSPSQVQKRPKLCDLMALMDILSGQGGGGGGATHFLLCIASTSAPDSLYQQGADLTTHPCILKFAFYFQTPLFTRSASSVERQQAGHPGADRPLLLIKSRIRSHICRGTSLRAGVLTLINIFAACLQGLIGGGGAASAAICVGPAAIGRSGCG